VGLSSPGCGALVIAGRPLVLRRAPTLTPCPPLTLAEPLSPRGRIGRAAHVPAPVIITVAHNKGGVAKTTSTFVLGKHLSRSLRVEMVDLDRTSYLTEVVAQLAPRGDFVLTPRLWLRADEPRPADVVLIDSEPAREQYAREALLRADYVLIPVPPEPLCIKGLELMLEVVEAVRTDPQGGNPSLQVLGVLPTLYDQRWPNHRAWIEEIKAIGAERHMRVFPPIPRRQSYTTLSMAGQDYGPVADAVRALVRDARARAHHG